jgi:hypothetical protein
VAHPAARMPVALRSGFFEQQIGAKAIARVAFP